MTRAKRGVLKKIIRYEGNCREIDCSCPSCPLNSYCSVLWNRSDDFPDWRPLRIDGAKELLAQEELDKMLEGK